MGQDQNLWGGIESYGAGIYIYRESIGQDQNLWGWIGTCGAELESMGQDWDLWGRVSVPAGVGIPYCGVWGRAAARGGPGNRLGRGCRGARPAGGAKVRGQRSGRAVGVGSEGLTARWRLAPPPPKKWQPGLPRWWRPLPKMAASSLQYGGLQNPRWRLPAENGRPRTQNGFPFPPLPPPPQDGGSQPLPTPHPSSNMAAPSPQDGGSHTWAAILPEATHRA